MQNRVLPRTAKPKKIPSPIPPRLALSIKELCQSLGISRSQIYKLIAAGALQTQKVGRRTIIAMSEAHRFVNSLPECDNCRSPGKAVRAKQ
jgi:excisionase family DNA binding protein